MLKKTTFLTVLILLLCCLARAEKFNGKDLKESNVQLECISMRFLSMGHVGVKGLTNTYFIRIDVKNVSDSPCLFDPYAFQVVTTEGKQLEVRKLIKTHVERGQMDSLLPGAAKEYGLIFDAIKLDKQKPTKLYYRSKFLGDFTN